MKKFSKMMTLSLAILSMLLGCKSYNSKESQVESKGFSERVRSDTSQFTSAVKVLDDIESHDVDAASYLAKARRLCWIDAIAQQKILKVADADREEVKLPLLVAIVSLTAQAAGHSKVESDMVEFSIRSLPAEDRVDFIAPESGKEQQERSALVNALTNQHEELDIDQLEIIISALTQASEFVSLKTTDIEMLPCMQVAKLTKRK